MATAELRNVVMAQPLIIHQGVTLRFRPWNRFAQATKVTMRTKVDLVMEGVPPHAWDREVAVELLGTSCSIDEIEVRTHSRRDLGMFRCSAWTSDPAAIPPARTLAIPEPAPDPESFGPPSPAREFSDESHTPPAERRRDVLDLMTYKVLIHIDRVEEDTPA
jgi:hypothetical protein